MEFSYSEKIITINGCQIKLPYTVDKVAYDKLNDQFIILFHYMEEKNSSRFKNLYAYNASGSIIWVAELPANSNFDAYTSIKLKSGQLDAFSFSCNACHIDLSNGKIIEQKFTK